MNGALLVLICYCFNGKAVICVCRPLSAEERQAKGQWARDRYLKRLAGDPISEHENNGTYTSIDIYIYVIYTSIYMHMLIYNILIFINGMHTSIDT